MRRTVVAILAVVEVLVACAIFACSLQVSHAIVRNRDLNGVAAIVLRSTRTLADSTRHFADSTRRLAESGVQVHITIGNA